MTTKPTTVFDLPYSEIIPNVTAGAIQDALVNAANKATHKAYVRGIGDGAILALAGVAVGVIGVGIYAYATHKKAKQD